MTAVKIVTVCLMGISRSVGMIDVLKLHFEPVDAIPIGYQGNREETKSMLFDWADHIIVMQEYMVDRIPEEYHHKLHVCEVGADTYGAGGKARAPLIDKCWRWLRANNTKLGITEYFGQPTLPKPDCYKKGK